MVLSVIEFYQILTFQRVYNDSIATVSIGLRLKNKLERAQFSIFILFTGLGEVQSCASEDPVNLRLS